MIALLMKEGSPDHVYIKNNWTTEALIYMVESVVEAKKLSMPEIPGM